MKFIKSHITALVAFAMALVGLGSAIRHGVRARTRDSINPQAFTYRMGAGFAGDVNRSHPASIEPCLLDATNPPPFAGFAVLVNTAANTVRQFLAGDVSATTMYGVAVRAFPVQISTTSAAYGAIGFGSQPLSASQPVDIMRTGYILVQLNSAAGAVTKGGQVHIWCTATSGGHTQGGFESAATASNTADLDVTRYTYNGPADANGIVEIAIVG